MSKMIKINRILSLYVVSVVFVLKISAENLAESFQRLEIVPDILDVAPIDKAQVTFPSGQEANLGNELTPTEVHDPPTVHWSSESGKQYTLIMTDPDAPSRSNPIMREWCHWLVANIPNGNVGDGETLVEFVPSGPPKDTQLHRYTFLIYEQPHNGIHFEMEHLNNLTASGRENFSTRDFAKKYNLGNPVAGNFYQAQYDDSVPAIHKQLGFNL